MNVYLISANTTGRYTYDSAVVLAESEEEARNLHPGDEYVWSEGMWVWRRSLWLGEPASYDSSWTTPDRVSVKLIALNAVDAPVPGDFEDRVILSSFNDG